MIDVEVALSDLRRLLQSAETQDYIGEAISQGEHALQCAHFARKAGADDELVIASLLHDIGHLCAEQDAAAMGAYGVSDHEALGAAYLARRGFSSRVCELVRQHVNAKRYLVRKSERYGKALSEASRATLAFQGGPMSDEEFAAYQARADLADILRLRSFDEQAKVIGLDVANFSAYEPAIRKHLLRDAS